MQRGVSVREKLQPLTKGIVLPAVPVPGKGSPDDSTTSVTVVAVVAAFLKVSKASSRISRSSINSCASFTPLIL